MSTRYLHGPGVCLGVGVVVGVGIGVEVAVGVGVGVGVEGAAKPLTRMILSPEPDVEKRKSPVTGSIVIPSAPIKPQMKSRWFAMIGSPLGSRGAVMTLLFEYWAMRALLAVKTGEPGVTKPMPSAPPPMFARRVAELKS